MPRSRSIQWTFLLEEWKPPGYLYLAESSHVSLCLLQWFERLKYRLYFVDVVFLVCALKLIEILI